MALKSGIFNSVNGDRVYKAEDFAAYFASFIGNGVFPNPSNGFQVIAGNGISVNLKAGKAWINGYYATNDGDYNLQLDVADGVLNRIDRVVLQLNFLNRIITPVVKKGVFASSPVAPSLKRDADAYEIALADIRVNKGALSITQANITDLRLNDELCGIVHGVVDQVDTTTIFNQYQSWYSQFTNLKALEFDDFTETKRQEYEAWSEQQQSDFNAWFTSIQDILDGDVAGNILNQIEQVNQRVTDLNDVVDSHIITNATLTTKGHIQLSSATNSTSEELAATPKAVKAAYDRADAAFTQANDGKTAVANAVTAKGIPASPADTFPTLASKIGQIKLGVVSEVNAGESLVFQDTTSVSVYDVHTYQKFKEYRIIEDGTYRVSFTMRKPTSSGDFSVRIYVNDFARGTARSFSAPQTRTYTQDFTLQKGDFLQVYSQLTWQVTGYIDTVTVGINLDSIFVEHII